MLILFGAPFLGLAILEGDNTLAGLMRLTISYNLTVFSTALVLLTIYTASTCLDSEFTERQIYLLDVKPVPRWVVLAGKCTGVILLNAWLLLIGGVILYGVLMVQAKPVKGRPEQLEDAYQQILISRKSFRPDLPDLRDEVKREQDRLTRENRIDPSEWDQQRLQQQIAAALNQKLLPVPFQGTRKFIFRGLPTAAADNREITLRYKLYGEREGESVEWLQTLWLVHNPNNAMIHQIQLVAKRGTTREIRIPSSVISPEGTVEISLVNLTGPEDGKPAAKINIPLSDGLELLVPTGSFGLNLSKALLLLWIRLAMLAIIGVFANTFVRGSIAAFLLTGILIGGMLHPTVMLSLIPPRPMIVAQTQDTRDDTIRNIGAAFLNALPDFGDTDSIPDLSVGRLIRWSKILHRIVMDILCRGGVFFLVGLWAFRIREVGRPTYE